MNIKVKLRGRLPLALRGVVSLAVSTLQSSAARARRNLRLYPWYVAGIGFFAWMPIFFLYYASRVSLSEVLALEAIYYAAVVLLELPSGYFSDRVGRRPTLILAAFALLAAYVLFPLANSFGLLALAQILLAVGLAFNSGTDTSFHLASLTCAGLQEEYAEREARLGSLSFAVGAVAAVLGGVLGTLDLRWPYVAAALAAFIGGVAALAFQTVEDEHASQSFLHTVRDCVLCARDRSLGWVFVVVVTATVINHIPYEFYQPYLEALSDVPWPTGSTPLVAGVHVALVWLVAAPVARGSAALAKRLGTVRLLLASLLLQLGLIGLMALAIEPWIAVLLVVRAVPGALQDAPVRAAVAPRVKPQLRATYLSLQSLAGRLGFAVLLLGLSLLSASTLSELLHVCGVVAGILILGVVALARWLGPELDA